MNAHLEEDDSQKDSDDRNHGVDDPLRGARDTDYCSSHIYVTEHERWLVWASL
jgi:hypothetical protein